MKEFIIAIVVLLAGFVLLVKGADFFVEGASNVAKKLKIPSLIIGLTIVAMGTSLPECSVSVIASLAGSNSLSISNAVGSNIFNLMMVCGICSMFVPLAVAKETIKRDFPISVLCAILLILLGSTGMVLGREEGIILMLCFAAFIALMIVNALKSRNSDNESNNTDTLPVWKCLLFIVGGAFAIKYGGDFVVDGATQIAKTIGLSDTVIGLTIVAMGTSLPELVTSIVAAKKNEVDMAVGNVIGSNIFNILLVLGIAGTISPISFITANIVDGIVLIAFSAIVWFFSWTKKQIARGEGIVLVGLYALYMVYIVLRDTGAISTFII